MIHAYIKKLRRAADVLEELLETGILERPRAAAALRKRVAANLASSPVRGPRKRPGPKPGAVH